MRKAVWCFEGADYGAFLAGVAAIIGFGREVTPDGVANHHVHYMASGHPDGHEHGEDYVADSRVAEIF